MCHNKLDALYAQNGKITEYINKNIKPEGPQEAAVPVLVNPMQAVKVVTERGDPKELEEIFKNPRASPLWGTS